jgi:hypothetical protein
MFDVGANFPNAKLSTRESRAAAVNRISGIGMGIVIPGVELAGPCPRPVPVRILFVCSK